MSAISSEKARTAITTSSISMASAGAAYGIALQLLRDGPTLDGMFFLLAGSIIMALAMRKQSNALKILTEKQTRN